MSVLLYASRFKCDYCGQTVDVQLPEDEMFTATLPDGWARLRIAKASNMLMDLDFCLGCGTRSIHELVRWLESKP